MSTPEIILLLVAIGALFFSFVLADRERETKSNDRKPELSKEQELDIKRQINQLIEDAIANGVIDAEEKMNKISNEKIMAVNEFSNQLLEKIDQNNKEVVFLYDMLCQKQEEMKSTFAKMEMIRRENKELSERLVSVSGAMTQSKKDIISRTLSSMESNETSSQESLIERVPVNKEEDDAITVEDMEALLKENSVSEEANNPNEKILRLYKQNKSIKEISRELGIGQGEVKLIIDLHAKKN